MHNKGLNEEIDNCTLADNLIIMGPTMAIIRIPIDIDIKANE